MHNPEKDALIMKANREKILRTAYNLFSNAPIENVTMNAIATASDLGVATVYRYFGTKAALVMNVFEEAWGKNLETIYKTADTFSGRDGRAAFERYLDFFMDLYREHKQFLRFNQFFNSFIMSQTELPQEATQSLIRQAFRPAFERFERAYQAGLEDHTLNPKYSAEQMFLSSMHLMMAAITRYSVGLVYTTKVNSTIEELEMLKGMLYRQFTLPATNA